MYLCDSTKHSLLCFNQAKISRVVIQDISHAFDKSSFRSIYFPHDDICLLIQYNGPVPYINVVYPSIEEMEQLQHLHITSEVDWEPSMIVTTYIYISNTTISD